VTISIRESIVYEQWGTDSLELVRRREFGGIYCALPMPRMFCYGAKSVSQPTLDYLVKHQLESQAFHGAHWFMLDQPRIFWGFLAEFLHTEAAASPTLPRDS
jgi:hypothetical protein